MATSKTLLKKLDLSLLVIFPIISVSLSLLYQANFLTSILLFFGFPSLWFSFRTKDQVAKTLLFSLVLTIPLGIFIDYLGTINGSWFVPTTVFSLRLFGVVPIEDLVWAFTLVYYMVILYEHFLDKGKHELVDKKMKYLIWPLLFLLLIFFVIMLSRPELLIIPYLYLWVGVLFILLPTISFLSFFPRIASKYIKISCYFFLLSLLFEITGLQLNQWIFPGTSFIGWVSMFGQRFPFEEFFFWFVMGTACTLSYYEFFDDDRK